MQLELSPRQRTAIAVAITIVAVAIILAAIGSAGWAIAVFFSTFANVFLPLAVAGVMALVFRPYYIVLNRRLRLPKPIALAVMLLSIVLPIAAFGTFFGARLLEQVNDLVARMPELWERLKELLREHVPIALQYTRSRTSARCWLRPAPRRCRQGRRAWPRWCVPSCTAWSSSVGRSVPP